MKHKQGSKIAKINAHLLSGESITPLKAIGLYRVTRLASDINRLRDDGLFVITTNKLAPMTGDKYAEYSIPKTGMKVIHTEKTERGLGTISNVRPNSLGELCVTVAWANQEFSTYGPNTQRLVTGA